MKRFISLCLALVIVISAAAVTVTAEMSGDWVYLVENGEAIIQRCYMRNVGEIEVPAQLGVHSVTGILADAFYDCSYAVKVTLTAGIRTIEAGAFSHMQSLASIDVDSGNPYFLSENGILFNKQKTAVIAYPPKKQGSSYALPSNVTEIKDYAFLGCEYLESITLPQGLTAIGYNAFGDSGLKIVTIPGSVETIGDYAFEWCADLSEVVIETGVKYIGISAFVQCYNLESVSIPSTVVKMGRGHSTVHRGLEN